MLNKGPDYLLKAICTAFVLVVFIQYSYANRQNGVLDIKNVVVSYLCQESDSLISLREYRNEPDSILCNVYNEKTKGECSRLEELWKRAELKCKEVESVPEFLDCFWNDIRAHLVENKDTREGKEEFLELTQEIQTIIANNTSPKPGGSESGTKPVHPIDPRDGSVEKTSFNWLGLLGVILIFLCIGASAFLWFRFIQLESETDRRLHARLKKEEVQRFSDDMLLLNHKLENKVSKGDFTEYINGIEQRVSKIERLTERVSTSSFGTQTIKPGPTRTSPPPPSRHFNRYAFFPENNLFEDKTLQDDPDHNEAIYHLSFREDSIHGEYVINQSVKAIQLALSDLDQFLSPGADFEQRPSGSTGIINLCKGELKRVGEGWQIVRKVKIKFE